MKLFRLCCLYVISCCMGLAACQQGVVYHVYQPVDNIAWERTDTLHFDCPRLADGGRFRCSVGIRFQEQMPYRDVNLVLEHRIGNEHQRDTLSLMLTDDDGKWLTQGVALHEYEAEAATIEVPATATVELLIYHIMPRQSLTGLTEVGLKIEKL